MSSFNIQPSSDMYVPELDNPGDKKTSGERIMGAFKTIEEALNDDGTEVRDQDKFSYWIEKISNALCGE